MYKTDLGSALCASALAHPDRPALWANGVHLSYRELFGLAASISIGLRQAGVLPGDRVAILAAKSPAAYAGVIAALLTGCTYVPLNPLFRPERNGAVLRAAEASAIILGETVAANPRDYIDEIGDDLAVILPDMGSAKIGAGRVQLTAQDLPAMQLTDHDPHPGVGRDEAAVILFTSGTTGVPKGVPISHANIAAYLWGVSNIVGVNDQDRCMQLVGLTFDLSMHDMFLTWLNGAELYAMPENVGTLMTRLVRQHSLTSCFIVPSAVARSVEQGQAKPGSMPSLRSTFIAGEALPRTVAKAWSEAAPNSEVFNLYGPTEATVSVTWYKFDPETGVEFAGVPIGRPFGRESACLFDTEMKPTADGDYGQILLAGAQVATGYWKAPHLDAEKFEWIDGVRWYKTGDIGRWVEPHGLVFAGRADRQVKIRGFLVELQEVEGVLRRISGRQEVAVVPWPMVQPGSFDGCIAFMCGAELDEGSLRAACRAEVSDYMTPDRVLFIESLPTNANGKVDYKVLAERLEPDGAP